MNDANRDEETQSECCNAQSADYAGTDLRISAMDALHDYRECTDKKKFEPELVFQMIELLREGNFANNQLPSRRDGRPDGNSLIDPGSLHEYNHFVQDFKTALSDRVKSAVFNGYHGIHGHEAAARTRSTERQNERENAQAKSSDSKRKSKSSTEKTSQNNVNLAAMTKSEIVLAQFVHELAQHSPTSLDPDYFRGSSRVRNEIQFVFQTTVHRHLPTTVAEDR